MTRYLFLLLTLTLGLHLFAQNINPLWIPFNDHGTWGFCDTLGNMQIEPAYESAGFFYPTTIDTAKHFVSRVKTEWGDNLLTSEGKLILPTRLNLVHEIYSKSSPNKLFLVQKKGKYGVFQYDEGWVVKAKYDTLARNFSFSSMYLMKREKDDTYHRFYPETLELEVTDIIEMGMFYQGYNLVEVVTKTDGSRYEVQGDKLVLIEPAIFSEYEDVGDMMLEEIADDWGNSYRWSGQKPTAEELGVDRVLIYKDYRSLGLGNSYGFERIVIAEKDGRQGVLNEQGETILAFEYNHLKLDDTSTQLRVEKDGKVGRKLLFTHYPMIEPQYDDLHAVYQLRVNPRWSFGIFEVEINGQKGFVGENTVEYFDFE